MGSHFHDWIGYYGLAILYELLEWGHTLSGFGGSENLGTCTWGFKNRKVYTTPSLTNVSVHFRMT